MKFTVYILWSEKLKKYYAGSTDNLVKRLKYHNAGKVKYTSKGTTWVLIWKLERSSRKEVFNLEQKIKKRGIKRYLQDINFLGT